MSKIIKNNLNKLSLINRIITNKYFFVVLEKNSNIEFINQSQKNLNEFLSLFDINRFWNLFENNNSFLFLNELDINNIGKILENKIISFAFSGFFLNNNNLFNINNYYLFFCNNYIIYITLLLKFLKTFNYQNNMYSIKLLKVLTNKKKIKKKYI